MFGLEDTFSVRTDPMTQLPELTFDTDNPALEDPVSPDEDLEIEDGYTVGDALDDAPTRTESVMGIDDGVEALGEQAAESLNRASPYLVAALAVAVLGIVSYVFGQLFTINLG